MTKVFWIEKGKLKQHISTFLTVAPSVLLLLLLRNLSTLGFKRLYGSDL